MGGPYYWQQRQRREIIGGMPADPNRPANAPFIGQKQLRRQMAINGSQPRSGETAVVAIPDLEKFTTMNEKNEKTEMQQAIGLLTEIRDLLKGGAGPAVASGAGVQEFRAETLAASVEKGKTYWKVMGGRFTQFGLIVWPEVLAAAGFSDLDPFQSYDLAGWVVRYTPATETENNRIVELVPPADPQPAAPPPPAPAPAQQRKPGQNGRGQAQRQERPANAGRSFLRVGDIVDATDLDGKAHRGQVRGILQDGTIRVELDENGKTYDLPAARVTAVSLIGN